MTPKTKVALLFFGLLVPFWLFIMLFVFRATARHAEPPSWVPWVALLYLLGSMTVASIVAPRFFHNAPSPGATPASKATMAGAKAYSLYLVLVWSGLFLYGAYQTLLGKFPLQRAVPAGAILLGFIGLFSWSIYRMHSSQRQ